MAQQYEVTLFPNWRTSNIQRKVFTWETLKEMFTSGHVHTSADNKKNTPAISPARFIDGATTKQAVNVLEVSLLVLDFDDATAEQTAAIQQHLMKENLRAIIYSSYNNNPSAPPLIPLFRFRVIVPLERAVPAPQWAAFWARETQKFPFANLDIRCKNPCWIYGLNHTQNIQAAFHLIFEGREYAVDLEGLALSTPRATQKYIASKSQMPGGESESTLAVSYAVTHKDLIPLIKTLKRTRPDSEFAASDQVMADWLTKIRNGEEYASPHTRHDTKLKITAKIERRFPKATIEDLTELFFASHLLMYKDQGMAAVDDAQKDTYYAFQGARARREALAAEKRSTVEGDLFQRATNINPAGAYTVEDLEEFAQLHGVSPVQFQRHWIIQLGSSMFFWTKDGYQGPHTLQEFDGAVARYLPPAEMCPEANLNLKKITDKGLAKKTWQELMDTHGSLATELEYSHHQPSTFNPKTGMVVIRCAVPAYAVGQYDEKIDLWLKALAGNNFKDLCRWLVLARDLTQIVPALYLHGTPGAGKSLFAECVASLWWKSAHTKQSTSLVAAERATAKFAQLLGHPVIFADESLPVAWEGPNGFARLREAVSSRSSAIEKKFHPTAPLNSCLRIILAANNENLLQGARDFTADDRSAVAQRLFDLEIVGRAAVDVLEQGVLAEPGMTDRWVNGAFLEHVEWLSEQEELTKRSGRFGIELQHNELVEKLAHNQGSVAAIGEWLVGFILDPDKWFAKMGTLASDYVYIGQEHGIAINHAAFKDSELWNLYTSDKFPSIRFRQTGLAQYRLREAVNGRRFAVLDIAQLARYADNRDLASAEMVEKAAASLQIRIEAILNGKPKLVPVSKI